jgi:hypothetical protein
MTLRLYARDNVPWSARGGPATPSRIQEVQWTCTEWLEGTVKRSIQ